MSGVLIFVAIVFGGPALAFAPFWVPSAVSYLPTRDPLAGFIVDTLRRDPEDWSGHAYGTLRHKSGLSMDAYRAKVSYPREVAFGSIAHLKVKRAVRGWERQQKRIEDAKARIAAIETITGNRASN